MADQIRAIAVNFDVVIALAGIRQNEFSFALLSTSRVLSP